MTLIHSKYSRWTSQLIIGVLGMVTVLPQTTLLIGFEQVLGSFKFDSALLNALLVPCIVILTILPTEIAVLLFNLLVPREVTVKEATVSLMASIVTPTIIFMLAAFSEPLTSTDAPTLLGIAVGLATIQSILIAPLKSFAYALTNTDAFRDTVACIMMGYLSLAVFQTIIASSVAELRIQLSYFVSIFVFSVALLLMQEVDKRLKEPVVIDYAKLDIIVLDPSGRDASPENETESALDSTKNVIKYGWPSLLTMVIAMATACSCYPTLCLGVEPLYMSSNLFKSLGVFIIPHSGAIAGAILSAYVGSIGKWAELAFSVVRFFAMLSFFAVSNFNPCMVRQWVPVLIRNDVAFLCISMTLFTINGIYQVEVFKTLARSVEPKYRQRAASLGTVFCVSGMVIGVGIAVAFPYLI